MKRILSIALVIVMLLGMIPAAYAAETIPTAITAQTLWSYLDNNTDPAGDPTAEGYVRTSWTAETYDDSGWKTAAAPFGAQNDGQTYNSLTPATKLEGSNASNDHFAYFFRTDIQIDSLEGMTQLKGTIEYDDAMILYINGVKVADGNNIACDASGATLGREINANLEYGGANLGNPNSDKLALTDLSMLHEGVNTVAVEIHQQRKTSTDIWFNMTLELSDEPLPDAQSDISLSMGADETQMNFTWYAPSNEAGVLLLAKNADVVDGVMPETAAAFQATATGANDGQYSNQVTVTGLEAGVTYAYQLVNGEDRSEIHTFTTGSKGAFSFAYVGDPQIGAGGNVVNDTNGWANTLNQVATSDIFSDISFMLSAGDQVNNASSESEYDGYLNHEALAGLPVATVIGNHDSGSDAYNEHFNLANESTEYGTTAAGGDSWFVYNNVLFLVLNSNDQSAAEHKAFMEAAIAANPDVDWKIVTFHHSLYTVASHAYDSDILSRRQNWVPIFDELGIDVVLQGHDHVYCRSYIMDGLTPITDASTYNDAGYSSITNPDGILYVTANSGSGSKTYNIKNETFAYSAVQNQEHIANVSKITVSDEAFTITTYRATDMSVIDTFTIYHDRVLEAEDAKEAAEAAQKAAEEAQAAAEAAQKAAEEAAAQSSADKAAAETAKAEAETAKAEAEAALKAAEEAQKAAEEAAKQAAADRAAMEEAAKAAQEALAKAEAAQKAAEEAQKAAEEAAKDAHCPSDAYSDVARNAWYHEAVDYVLKNNLMQGDGDDTFDPAEKLTRASLIQILYNMEGRPTVTGESKFSDVRKGAWYYDAVIWAAEEGIAAGYDNGTFGPEDLITREQMVAILWRYAGKPEAESEQISFKDAADVSDYAAEAILWAAENGIVCGVGDNQFVPGGNATRAQVAQLMKTFCELLK